MSRTARVAIAVVTVAAAAVAFVVAKPDDDDEPSSTTTATQRSTAPSNDKTAPARPPAPRTQRIELHDGQPVGGPRRIEVESGDRVRIVVRSDTPDEVHLHGYDITRQVAPGQPARFAFRAKLEGQFELEAHHAGDVRIAALVVAPG
jgi:hypothetical protein